MYLLYRAVSALASPLVPLLLKRRLAQGKEDADRLPERRGEASLPRPGGKLVWVHAASVGEAHTVLPLIEALLAEHAHLHVLLTTVTVTSAALVHKRLPPRALHQFAPVDTPKAAEGFLGHWRPDVALFVDSELWPNLLMGLRRRGVVTGLVNARMSERSFRRWRRVRPFVRELLSCFALCFAQSDADAERLCALGLPAVQGIGNLKYDAPPLACDAAELIRLLGQREERAVWVAASTHPGEEEMVAAAHRALMKQGLRPLTVLAPRHAARAEAAEAALGSLRVARRSRGEAITPDTDVYLADTMGELGLFYRFAPLAFIGGSLVPHGGQNPLEAARLGCAVIAGPHMENFAAIAAAMERENALVRVQDGRDLAKELWRLFTNARARDMLVENARRHVRAGEGTLSMVTRGLRPYLGSDK